MQVTPSTEPETNSRTWFRTRKRLSKTCGALSAATDEKLDKVSQEAVKALQEVQTVIRDVRSILEDEKMRAELEGTIEQLAWCGQRNPKRSHQSQRVF